MLEPRGDQHAAGQNDHAGSDPEEGAQRHGVRGRVRPEHGGGGRAALSGGQGPPDHDDGVVGRDGRLPASGRRADGERSVLRGEHGLRHHVQAVRAPEGDEEQAEDGRRAVVQARGHVQVRCQSHRAALAHGELGTGLQGDVRDTCRELSPRFVANRDPLLGLRPKTWRCRSSAQVSESVQFEDSSLGSHHRQVLHSSAAVPLRDASLGHPAFQLPVRQVADEQSGPTSVRRHLVPRLRECYENHRDRQ